MMKWFKGKKTYSGLATAGLGALLVFLDHKLGVTGLAEWGYTALAGGLGFATYGRSAVASPLPKKAPRAHRNSRKVTVNAA